jgi:arylsulfatase A-like enzyme
VTQGYAPCLIAAGRPTVASFLQTQGYKTSIVGKWHLDFQYLDPVTQEPLHRKQQRLPPVGARIPDGPISRGFDYFHGFHHAGDMQAVIQNDRVIEHDDEINMLPRLTTQAVNQIETLSQTQQPFFLYVPLSSPHTPILPSPEWQGKSGLGDYGDFVMQTDHALGEIMSAIERSGCEDNTLLIFTSDNGCSKAANIPELARQGHHVSGPYRGSKADLWEGGHRVPFIVRWPGRIKQGSTCQQSLCLTDLFATVAEILLTNLPDGSAEDSVSFLPALTGQLISPVRSGIVHHSISGHFGYRHDNWKLLLAYGSGGWTSPKEQKAREQGLPAAQLYRLDRDPAETENLAAKNPETFGKLLGLLKADVDRGRSTPGNNVTNDTTDIRLWKSGEPQNLGSAVGSAP